MRLGLHPEEVFLAAGSELEDKDAAVGGGVQVLSTFFLDERVEVTVGGEHDQVEVRIGGLCGTRSPAEVHQFIFGVEVDVAWSGLWFDLAAGEVAATGFECDER